MRNKELKENIAKNMGKSGKPTNPRETDVIFKTVLECIKIGLTRDDEVYIENFGILKVHKAKAYDVKVSLGARRLKETGETHTIAHHPARRYLKFRTTGDFKKEMRFNKISEEEKWKGYDKNE